MYAQTDDSTSTDGLDLPFEFQDESFSPSSNTQNGGLYLNNPSNIKSDVEYNHQTGKYEVKQTIGDGLPFRPSESMSIKEYLDYDMAKSYKDFWNKRRQEEIEEKTEEKGGGFRPEIDLNNEVIDRIFGSDKIEIKPQGSVEVIMGVQSSKTANPAIPIQQQRITNFLFDQKIQFNLQGSIGDKMKLNLSFNTEAMFNFENLTKLTYEGKEDDIIQLIELGNVSLPLNSSLITGSQTLFGVKTGLKFGKLNVTTILSQQQGKKESIEIKNGAQVQDFEVKADEYEYNKHFFLDHFFRDRYEQAVSNPPLINSDFFITKIEVYKTPRNVFDNTRNIIAFQDLGTADPSRLFNPGVVNDLQSNDVPFNKANSLYDQVNKPSVRGFSGAVGALNAMNLQDRKDYLTIGQAELLQEGQHYTVNKQLGYISLNTELPVDFALCVAFQFTYRGKTYQVGEFSTDGIVGEQALILKMLKSVELDFKAPMWDLMMKNIYGLGNAYQVKKEGFMLDVWYLDAKTGVQINYFPDGSLKDKSIIQVLGMDKLTINNQPTPDGDGVFDFLNNPMITIDPEKARLIFTKLEPFGSGLRSSFPNTEQSLAEGYAFDSLYVTSRSLARVNFPNKNRFYIRGQYQSDVTSEFSLGAFNLPQGSVSVTQGGRRLVENSDYTVDYNLGRVKIINPSLLEAASPIQVDFESNSLFNAQQKSMMGARFDYEFNKHLHLGGTLMNLRERPITQKVNAGFEPINNTMLGLDATYNDESEFLTDILKKIPFLNSKGKAKVNFTGEFAKLIPGNSRAIGRDGVSYLDDFEGSVSTIELRSPIAWKIASTPQGQPGLFPEGNLTSNLANGYNRAKLAWYTVDPSVFYRSNNLVPSYILDDDSIVENHFMRWIPENEVFPNRQLNVTQSQFINMFDLSYYPSERGPYNYDVDGTDTSGNTYSSGIDTDGNLINPQERWGGIMREINTNDFDASNVEFIQFWMMDPYAEAGTDGFSDGTNTGELFINIGNISEDILRDDQRFFENGLGSTQQEAADLSGDTLSPWGRVIPSSIPYLLDAFDNNPSTRPYQDVGLDGLANEQEQIFFKSSYLDRIENKFGGTNSNAYLNAQRDPSNDDYHYFLGDDYDQDELDILERYKDWNNFEGNSPTSDQYAAQNQAGYPTTASTLPNTEDINRDKTINYGESYYQYRVKVSPGDINENAAGSNYITNVLETNANLQNGTTKPVKWYQFKIPVRDLNREAYGGIQGLNSIRFMRIFVKGFKDPLHLRFARLELVTGQWRKYLGDGQAPGEHEDDDAFTSFNIGAVNIEENAQKSPVNYVLPPTIDRQVDLTTVNQVLQNEQALFVNTCDLGDGTFVGAYRNFDYDVRMYRRLQMFVHGESVLNQDEVLDDELKVFVRMGTDFENNYYEYEVPLKITPGGQNYFTAADNESSRLAVWPSDNNFDIEFAQLQRVKLNRNSSVGNNIAQYSTPFSAPDPNYPDNNIIVVGNPNLSTLKTVMVGVKNPKDNGPSKCVEVWVNELRLTDFNNDGGWATIGRVVSELPGLGTLSLSGGMSTPGFGSIEKRVSERQLETNQHYDLSFETDLGKLLGEKTPLQAPMYVGYAKNVITPRFNPLDPDVETKTILTNTQDDFEKDSILKVIRDVTTRKSLNFTGVRKLKSKKSKKSHFYDVSNLTASYAFTETHQRNFTLERDLTKTYHGNLTYSFSPTSKPIEPFKKAIKSKHLSLIKDFNFYTKPKQIGFSTDIDRFYNERITRNTNPGIKADLPPFYNKTFRWARKYDLKYDITKNLKFDFNAINQSLIEEPLGAVDKKNDPGGYDIWKSQVWNNVMKGGENIDYRHQANLNYTLPIHKLPYLNWVKTTAKYGVNYNWIRAPFAAEEQGHTIQNSNTVQVNGNFNFKNLYNNIPYLKKVDRKFKKAASDKRKKPKGNSKLEKGVKKVIDDISDSTKTKKEIKKQKREKSDPITITDRVAKVLMGVKTASLTYNQDNGMILPGVDFKSNLMGMRNGFTAPGVPFITATNNWLGDPTAQDDFAPYAASKGWLIQGQNITTQHITTHNEKINFRSSIEPIKDFRVDLTANSTYGFNTNQFYNWNDSILSPIDGTLGWYEPQSYIENGMFSRSYISWGTAFDKIDSNFNSAIHQAFLNSRDIISNRLEQDRINNVPGYSGGLHPLDSGGYTTGFGATNQEVLIPTFLATYGGKDPKKQKLNPIKGLPAVNWRVTYTGLKNVKLFKKYFRNFSISHGYKSSISFGSFTSNLLFTENQEEGNSEPYTDSLDGKANFINRYQINTVVLSEQIAPLIKIDMTFKNSLQARFEIKKDRTVTLSVPNTQITEMNGLEFVIGSGYTIPKVKFPWLLPGQSKKVTSALNLRVDFSMRDNKTGLRKIVENTITKSSGQKVYSLKTAADYKLSQKMTLRYFFDWISTDPFISNSFPTSNIKSGISLRFTL